MALIKTSAASINQLGDTITIVDNTGEDNILDSTKYSTGGTNLNRNITNQLTDVIITLPDGTSVSIRNNILIDSSVVSTINPPLPVTSPLPIPNSGFTKAINTALANILSTQIFPVGVYTIKYNSWYLIPCTGNGGSFTLSSSVGITDASNTSLLNTIRSGFSDTSLIKIFKTTDTTIESENVVDTITDAHNIILNKPLSNLVIGDKVFIFAGYSNTLYVKVQTDLLSCFQPKIAKSTIRKRSCCKTCKSSDIDEYVEILFGIFAVDAQFQNGDYPTANSNLQTLLKICQSKDCNC